jgi:hypothetical protein
MSVKLFSVIFSLLISFSAWAASPYSQFPNGPSADPNYFPIGVWLQGPNKIQEYKNIGINVFVGFYGDLDQTSLAQFASASMSLIPTQNNIGLRSAQRTAIKGWLLFDEPDNAQPDGKGGYGRPCIPPSTVIGWYNDQKANDPTRPVLLNFGRGVAKVNWAGRGSCTGDTSYYQKASAGGDILAFDVYPISGGYPLEDIAKGVSNLRTWSNNQKIIWNYVEAAAINGSAIPTGAQVRSEAWMSIVHGSMGIIYFAHEFAPKFREDGLFNHPALVQAIGTLNSEIKSLAPILNSPTLSGLQTSSAVPVATMMKQYAGATYVFATAMRGTATTASFTLPSLVPGTVEVLNENRTLALSNGKFQDSFAGYGVHIYRIATELSP